LGSWEAAKNVPVLKVLGITHVLIIAHDVTPKYDSVLINLHMERFRNLDIAM
jgi:hypothetical protein